MKKSLHGKEDAHALPLVTQCVSRPPVSPPSQWEDESPWDYGKDRASRGLPPDIPQTDSPPPATPPRTRPPPPASSPRNRSEWIAAHPQTLEDSHKGGFTDSLESVLMDEKAREFIAPMPDPSPPEDQEQQKQHDGCYGWFLACLGVKKNALTSNPSTELGPLLPPLPTGDTRKTLVLDLDETLVHSSFKPLPNADFIIALDVDGRAVSVYVAKRPGVDGFLVRMGLLFEVVIFTASLARYADPVIDLLDANSVVNGRLFREACSIHRGAYTKDLARLGRNLDSVIIVDNSPTSYQWQPSNAVPISSWYDDPTDVELDDLALFLEELSVVDDVCSVLGM